MDDICIFMRASGSSQIKHQRLVQFANGIRKAGDKVSLISGKYRPCRVAIFIGAAPDNLKSIKTPNITRRMRNEILLGQQACGGITIIIEAQLIGRDIKEIHGKYYRVGLNHHLPNRAEFLNHNSPSDRWEMICQEANLTLLPWRTDGSHILLIGQQGGHSCAGINQIEWMEQTISQLRKSTDRPIMIRPKYENIYHQIVKKYSGVTVVDNKTQMLSDNLVNAWASGVFASTAAISSLIHGVPLFTGSEQCFGYEIANHDFLNIESPEMKDREQFLYNLAYAQWKPSEFEDGTVWRRFRDTVM